MIKHTIKVPALGIEIDGSKVDSIDVDVDDNLDYYYIETYIASPPRPKVVIRFKGGGTLDLSNVQYDDHLYTLENTVEFELGASYIVTAGNGHKWAAVCVHEDVFEGKKLIPVKGYGHGIDIHQDDNARFNYTYEEFLPGEEVKKLL
jgi:hypothetical protein